MESKYQSVIKQLEKSNFRLTYQRKEIIRTLLEINSHIRTEELYELVKAKGIGVATVYRTVELLREFDIIKIIVIGNERYIELKKFSENYTHINFKCTKCGKIFDYSDKYLIQNILQLIRYLENKYSTESYDVTILINGICSECRR